MIRQLAGAMALAVASFVGAIAPVHAQDQKGTLVFAVESLGAQTLDPILEGRPGNAVYQAAMYDSLVGFDLEKGGVGPGVAETLGTAARRPDLDLLHLRPGQKFHNGDKLTAHDVKFSLERQMAPDSLAAAAATHAAHHQEHRGGRRPDGEGAHDQPADRPAGQPVSRAVAPEGAIMPKNYIEKVGEEEFRKKPIGSGPWKFVRNVPGDRIEFDGRRPIALARHAALQGPACPAGAGGEHARRHGAHRRGGDRLDRAGDHAERLARRAGGAGGAGHHAGDLPVLGRLQARDEGQRRSPSRACARRCRWRSTASR